MTDTVKKVRLANVLKQYRIEHWINNDTVYKQVTITKDGNVFVRGEKRGYEIGRKRQFIIDLEKYPKTLLFIRQTIWDGGIGMATQEVHNCIVTENFPMFVVLENVLPEFLHLYFRTNDFAIKLSQIKISGSAQKAIHERDFLDIEINLPSLTVQKQIVEKLQKQQETHRQALKTIAELKTDLKALRQSLLQEAISGKLTNSNSAGFVQHPNTPFPIPKHWEWKKLGEIGNLARGKSKNRPRNDPKLFQNGIYPFVQTGDIARAEMYVNTYSQMYNDIGLAQSKIWQKGTLCITIAANIAKCAILNFESCFPDSVVGFVSNEITTKYIYYFIVFFEKYIDNMATEAVQKNINLDVLLNLKTPLPPLSEQVLIVEKVEKEMASISQSEKELASLQADVDLYWRSVLQSAFRF